MTETAKPGHDADERALELVPSRDVDARVKANPTPASAASGFTWLDQAVVKAFYEDKEAKLTALVRESAGALAGPDRVEARIRLLANAIATCKATLDLLVVRFGQLTSAQEIVVFDRVIMNTTKRLTMLLAEHREATIKTTRPAVVTVTHADAVHVEAE